MTERYHQISMEELMVGKRAVQTEGPLVLQQMGQHFQRMTEVVETVAQARGLAPADIYGPCRRKDIAQARFEAVYLIFNTLPVSFHLAALGVGRSDHTTAMNCIKRVENLMESDPDYKEHVAKLVGQLNSELSTQQ